MGEHSVRLIRFRDLALRRLRRFFQYGRKVFGYVLIARIRDLRFRIAAKSPFLTAAFFKISLQFVRFRGTFRDFEFVLFQQFHRMEQRRALLFFQHSLRISDRFAQFRTGEDARRRPRFLCRFDGALHQKIGVFVFERRNCHYGQTDSLFQNVDVQLIPVFDEHVRHIERDDHRNIHFHQLSREIEIAFEIGRVDDIDDAVGTLVEDEITRDDLFGRIGREGINAGQVDDVYRFASLFIGALPLIHGDARPVADVRRASRQGVEQSSLSRVRISRQSKFQHIPFAASFRIDSISTQAASALRRVSS